MKKPEDTAWELFEKTGKTGYYMLYKKLKDKKYELSDIIDCLQSIFKTPRESIKRRIEEVC